jgi:hypothetical protein
VNADASWSSRVFVVGVWWRANHSSVSKYDYARKSINLVIGEESLKFVVVGYVGVLPVMKVLVEWLLDSEIRSSCFDELSAPVFGIEFDSFVWCVVLPNERDDMQPFGAKCADQVSEVFLSRRSSDLD